MGDVTEDRRQLLQILNRVLFLVGDPTCDFSWSGWDDHAEAKRELKTAIAAVELGELPPEIHVWFLPTGDLQEVSMRSRWSDEYMSLASAIDALWPRLARR